MVTGDCGDLGAHVTQEQAKDQDQDHAIIQQPKMEVLHVQGHHQCLKIVSHIIQGELLRVLLLHFIGRVNGNWGSWGSWGSCNSNTGLRYRYRSCNNPNPKNGGSSCPGSSYSTLRCIYFFL